MNVWMSDQIKKPLVGLIKSIEDMPETEIQAAMRIYIKESTFYMCCLLVA